MGAKSRLVATLGFATLLLAPLADAGQFKRLNAGALAPGGQMTALASPQNQGAAMEMDAYEYQTGASASLRCRITFNNTGRALTLARIGVNGLVQASCTTPVNGTCDLGFVVHGGNLLFQCLVATGNGSPVAVGSAYVLVLEREPAPLAAADGDDAPPTRSGLGR